MRRLLFPAFHKGNKPLWKIADKPVWNFLTLSSSNYMMLKFRKISDEIFIKPDRFYYHYYFESLVNLSFFYVQITNKLHYYKLKMRKYLLPTWFSYIPTEAFQITFLRLLLPVLWGTRILFESNIFSVYSYLNIKLNYTCLNIPLTVKWV